MLKSLSRQLLQVQKNLKVLILSGLYSVTYSGYFFYPPHKLQYRGETKPRLFAPNSLVLGRDSLILVQSLPSPLQF